MVVDRLENAVVVPAPSVVESDSGTIVHIVDAGGKGGRPEGCRGPGSRGIAGDHQGVSTAGASGHRRWAPDDPPWPPGQDGAGRADPAWNRRDQGHDGRSGGPDQVVNRGRRSRRSRSSPILPGKPTFIVDFFILPPADLRHGLGLPDAPDRRDLRVPVADRSVPSGCPAPRSR